MGHRLAGTGQSERSGTALITEIFKASMSILRPSTPTMKPLCYQEIPISSSIDLNLVSNTWGETIYSVSSLQVFGNGVGPKVPSRTLRQANVASSRGMLLVQR